MTDDTTPAAEAPSPAPRLPWDLHPALSAERLAAAARLLVRGRADALAHADPWMGDDAWSIGCRAYSFSRHQVTNATRSGRFPWLKVLDETHHFVFLVDGVPVRFFRGDAEDPIKRTLRQQETEAQQLALALGSEGTEGLMFRLAVETEADGSVRRVVFLALRGEEGQVECFWPVPLGDAEARSNSGATMPLPLAAGRQPSPRRGRRSPKPPG